MGGALVQLEVMKEAKGQHALFRLMGNGSSLTGDPGSKILGRRELQPENSCTYGVAIGYPRGDQKNSKDLTVRGAIEIDGFMGNIRGTCGDGILIGDGTNSPERTENVTVDGPIISNNFRQGISVLLGRNITIKNTTIRGTTGTNPGYGIDVEPHGGGVVENVQIVDNLIEDNRGGGINVYGSRRVVTRGIVIAGNTIRGNHAQVTIRGGGTQSVTVTKNKISSPGGGGLEVYQIGPGDGPVTVTDNDFSYEGVTTGRVRACIRIHQYAKAGSVENVVLERNKIVGCPAAGIELSVLAPKYNGAIRNISIRDNYLLNNGNRTVAQINIIKSRGARKIERIFLSGNTIKDTRTGADMSKHALNAGSGVTSEEKSTWSIGKNDLQGNWRVPMSNLGAK